MPIPYAAQCLKSADAVISAAISQSISVTQTSDDRMTSFAMTEQASFYSHFVTLARTGHLRRKLSARDYWWCRERSTKLFPSILPAMP